MFLASDAIKRHFGAHTESQESSSLPVAKHFLGLCLTKRCLMFLRKCVDPALDKDRLFTRLKDSIQGTIIVHSHRNGR